MKSKTDIKEWGKELKAPEDPGYDIQRKWNVAHWDTILDSVIDNMSLVEGPDQVDV